MNEEQEEQLFEHLIYLDSLLGELNKKLDRLLKELKSPNPRGYIG